MTDQILVRFWFLNHETEVVSADQSHSEFDHLIGSVVELPWKEVCTWIGEGKERLC